MNNDVDPGTASDLYQKSYKIAENKQAKPCFFLDILIEFLYN
jgi:hypothetical protein